MFLHSSDFPCEPLAVFYEYSVTRSQLVYFFRHHILRDSFYRRLSSNTMIFNSTSRQTVRDAERLWLAKSILRIITLVTSLIAIGCMAWSFAQVYNGNTRYLLPWQFITVSAWLCHLALLQKSIIVNVSHQLGVSILWNGANIIVRLSRPRPMHPGANVGMDLVLWLALIITGLLATVAALRNLNWISNKSNNPSRRPVKNPDGTYSYIYGEYGYFQNGTYGFVPDGTPGGCPDFSSCAARAVATSSIHHLGVVEAVGCGFTFLAVYVPAVALGSRRNALTDVFDQSPPLHPLRMGLRRRPPPQQRKSGGSCRCDGTNHHRPNGRPGCSPLRPTNTTATANGTVAIS